MENNNNRNYNQEDRNYTDAPGTTDPNPEYRKNPEQFEEFSNDHPNRYSDHEIGKHPDGMEDVDWDNDDDLDPENSSEVPDPIYDPNDDFAGGGIREDGDLDDEDELNVNNEDLDEESDFDSTFNEPDVDIDDEDEDEEEDDEINNEKSNLDDDWINRKV